MLVEDSRDTVRRVVVVVVVAVTAFVGNGLVLRRLRSPGSGVEDIAGPDFGSVEESAGFGKRCGW